MRDRGGRGGEGERDLSRALTRAHIHILGYFLSEMASHSLIANSVTHTRSPSSDSMLPADCCASLIDPRALSDNAYSSC